MWVYQFGYLDGDRPVWINPLWFWELPQGSPSVCRQSISDSWLGNLRECLAHLV